MTLNRHLNTELRIELTKSDSSLYFWLICGKWICINGSYVDRLICAGTTDFRNVSEKSLRHLKISVDDATSLTLSGLYLKKLCYESLIIDQSFYLNKLECLESYCGFREFQSMRMRIAWPANKLLDMSFETSQPAQATEILFEKRHHSTWYTHNNAAILALPNLDFNSIRIVGYYHAAIANSDDLTPQLGKIISLIGDNGAANPIALKI